MGSGAMQGRCLCVIELYSPDRPGEGSRGCPAFDAG